MNSHTTSIDIAVIGTGFSGICMAIKLLEAGIDSFILFEKADRVGGTWRDNIYPGAACDVPSALYSFSFEQNPNWSNRYPGQEEILQYLENCAHKYHVYRYIRFHCEIQKARYNDRDGIWHIASGTGEQFRAQVLISGVGQLSRPYMPNLSGLANFSGEYFHSARWNYDIDLRNQRVAVIGNGASAIQFVPIIADKVKQLICFQRSPNWINGKSDRTVSRFEKWLFKQFPFTMYLHRFWIYIVLESRFMVFKKRGLASRLAKRRLTSAMGRKIHNPSLSGFLKPDYPPGCKRILLSDDYLETLQQRHVTVVNDAITNIEKGSVVTTNGSRYPVDTIIFATGFEATRFLAPLDITGLNGKNISDSWRQGAEAYRGILVSGFPNLFLLYGPNTNLGHNSIIYMIESQVHYIMQCLNYMRRKRLKAIDVCEQAQRHYNQELQKDLAATVWSSGCTSWYKTATGKIVNNWPLTTWRYQRDTRRVIFDDFNVQPANKS